MNIKGKQEETIFEAARQIGDASQRQVYLQAACAGDPAMRERLQEMLAAQPDADGLFQGGAASLELPASTMALRTEKPGDRIGRYKLRETIGEGGCGVVYVAEQEEPVRRRVALKVIKLGMDTRNVIARFEAERQALAMMDHPNIAKVLDAGATETGRPFFVMELVRGIKITEFCDQNHLSTRERLELFMKVCQAVQHAHQKGIIHRDLKPSNILVTLHDGVPVPKVIDFGIAKATEGRLTDLTIYTELHQFIGTPAYVSPEQAEMSGLDIDTRSDIYSLGVLLYELLTGKTPFDAKELMAAGLDQMRRTIREQEPVRPSTRLGTMLEGERTTTAQHRHTEVPRLIHLLRGDLDWIVMRCLEKDRARRYDTANGLAMDIQRHLKSEPVVARPPSAAYKAQKFIRRNRVMATAAMIVALVLMLGALVSTREAFRANRAKGDAVTAATQERRQRELADQDWTRTAYPLRPYGHGGIGSPLSGWRADRHDRKLGPHRQDLECQDWPPTAHPQACRGGHVGGLFGRWRVDCHGELGRDRQGVGRYHRSRTTHLDGYKRHCCRMRNHDTWHPSFC
jgi:eukaryotic-like serine/threonine-protein kinase